MQTESADDGHMKSLEFEENFGLNKPQFKEDIAVSCLRFKTVIIPAILALGVVWIPSWFEWLDINRVKELQIRATAIHGCKKTENQSLFYYNECEFQ